MILTVFRPKRIKSGKVQIARAYRGRYRLDGEKKITDIPLHTTDTGAWPSSALSKS